MIAEAIASPSSRESTTPQASPQANTSSPCIWTDSAKARIERVPEGYMRDCTRALVEKYAKENGITNITLDVATIGIDQGKVTMEKAMKTGNVKEVIDQILKLE